MGHLPRILEDGTEPVPSHPSRVRLVRLVQVLLALCVAASLAAVWVGSRVDARLADHFGNVGEKPMIVSTLTFRDPELDSGATPVAVIPRMSGEEAAVWIEAIAVALAVAPKCTKWLTTVNGKVLEAELCTKCDGLSSGQCETNHAAEVAAIQAIYPEN